MAGVPLHSPRLSSPGPPISEIHPSLKTLSLNSEKCTICDRAFYNYGNLYKHMFVHNPKDKPFKCDLCDSSFVARTTLEEHVRIHSGETPFECDICNRKFTARQRLNQHKKIHGERTHKCDFCDKSYYQGGKLQRHIREVHQGRGRHVRDDFFGSFDFANPKRTQTG